VAVQELGAALLPVLLQMLGWPVLLLQLLHSGCMQISQQNGELMCQHLIPLEIHRGNRLMQGQCTTGWQG
jgi:hypothetical protein